MKNNKIIFEDVTFSYSASKNVIDRLSFELELGKYYVILGKNGSGKSTIAKLLNGLLLAESGNIFIDGLILNRQNIYQIRSKIGMVFQNPDNQFIGATVKDDIAFGLENTLVDPSLMDLIIEKYADIVDMKDYLDKEPSALSGGQKQRVAIAGVLAMNPSILILDEATSMLDPEGKEELNQLIKKMSQEKDLTIISITHNVEMALDADEVIIIDEGKIYKRGTPQQIFSNQKELEEKHLDIPIQYKIYNFLRSEGMEVEFSLDNEKIGDNLWQLISKN